MITIKETDSDEEILSKLRAKRELDKRIARLQAQVDKEEQDKQRADQQAENARLIKLYTTTK